MSEESAGAPPQRGFYFQNLGATYRLIVEDAENIPRRPTEIRTEHEDADFLFDLSMQGGKHHHYYESKFKESGEVKWRKFKTSIFPELYKIHKKYLPEPDHHVGWYHVVTNGSFASGSSKLSDIQEICTNLRGKKKWGVIKAKHERKILDPLVSAIKSSDKTDGADISMPDCPDHIYEVLYGLYFEVHSKRELELEITDYLRDVAPTNFTSAKNHVLKEVCSSPGEVIRREDIAKELDLKLRRGSASATNETQTMAELRSKATQERQRMAQSSYDDIKISDRKEQVEEYARRVRRETESNIGNNAEDAVSEDYEELKSLERKIVSTENRAADHIEQIQREDPGFSMEGDDE